VGLDGCWHNATAMIAIDRSMSRRAADPANLALARQVDGRSPAALPLAYDDQLGALIQWLPLDIWLPALASSVGQWRQLLKHAGVTTGIGRGEPVLLAYKPRRRAVLRLGRHVVKVYAGEDDFERAARGLATLDRLGHVPSPRCEAVIPTASATVQTLLRGRSPAAPLDVAGPAGQLLADLHRAKAEGAEVVSPSSQLAAAARSAALATTVVPELADRLGRLLADLENSLPSGLPEVLSHGDFHARQLLVHRQELSLVDPDELCVAPAALDLATFAAHLVGVGGADDLTDTGHALDALVDGYGDRPDALGWYLATAVLRRAPGPFRTLDDHWPQAVTAQVAAAEVVRRW